jgi:hypothetical protein
VCAFVAMLTCLLLVFVSLTPSLSVPTPLENSKADAVAEAAAAAPVPAAVPAAIPAQLPVHGRKSTLLALCPQLPPSMQRSEWCLDDYAVTEKLYKGYASVGAFFAFLLS